MNTALPQKFPFILNRNFAMANCTENHVCTSCDTEVLATNKKFLYIQNQCDYMLQTSKLKSDFFLILISRLP